MNYNYLIMLRYFEIGARLARKNFDIVLTLFFIDFFVLALAGIFTLDWFPQNIASKTIILHYNYYKILKTLPNIIKPALEIFIMAFAILSANNVLSKQNETSIENPIKTGIRNYISLLIIFIITLIAIIIPALIFLILSLAVFKFHFDAAINFSYIIAFFIMISVSIFFYFSPFELLIKKESLLNSLKESFALGRKNFWKIAVFINTYFAIVLISYFISAFFVGIYVVSVEQITKTINIGILPKYSIEAILSLILRFIYMTAIFASLIFFKELKNEGL